MIRWDGMGIDRYSLHGVWERKGQKMGGVEYILYSFPKSLHHRQTVEWMEHSSFRSKIFDAPIFVVDSDKRSKYC